jgi:NAD-dependent dihydropyrimidine dehydrogenase PreA subunit
MIFYFSGTGNSLYVAEKLHEAEGEELINIADALNENQFKYKVADDEKVGIVFPVYYYGLPTIVSKFISQLTLENYEKPFVYTVITCGSSIGHADKMLANLLKQRNLQLNSTYSIEMPDNYVMMFDVPDKEKQALTLRNAEKQIKTVIDDLKANKKGDFAKHGFIAPLTPIIYKIYGIYRNTKKFYITDACTSCGLCEEICPSKVIQLASGKPEWTDKKCSHCTACINRCPTKALQYGNSTKKRGRYVNPNVDY